MSKMKEKIPEEREISLRKEIVDALQGSEHSLGSLSRLLRKSEKEIVDHLGHIQKSENLIIEPAECLKCAFVFHERKRIKKPGKCPKCKSTYIDEPVYSIASK